MTRLQLFERRLAPRMLALASAVALTIPAVSAAETTALIPSDVTIGRNLQAPASVRFAQPVPEGGAQLTLRSDDPTRLLLAASPEHAGSASIVLTLNPRTIESPEFWLQAAADSGSASYTASAEGIGSAQGAVTFTPAAIVIVGPFRLPSFPTTPRSPAIALTLSSARLDSDLRVAEEQPVAGGSSVRFTVVNSAPEAARLNESQATLTALENTARIALQPASIGKAILTPEQPAGFTTPAEYSSVTVMIEKPGLAVVDSVMLGKDLQIHGILCLGETPPPGDVAVTLTSNDPSKLIFSAEEDEVGSGSIEIDVPEGQMTAGYFIQSLSDSGDVTYTASAPGYRSRMGKIRLTPSGVIIGYSSYGPPDEATVLQKNPVEDDRRFFASLASSQDGVDLTAWTAHLDPETGYAADITVQQLRAGVSIPIVLTSSNPDVGLVQSPLSINAGDNRAITKFIPRNTGETVISVSTPPGFSTPKNAVRVPATVTK